MTGVPPISRPFPSFDDGDVEIRLSASAEHKCQLHSLVLGLHSPFFKASLSRRWAGAPEAASSSDPVLWRYELRFEDGQAEGICVRKDHMKPDQMSAVGGSNGVGRPSLIDYDKNSRTALARARRNCIDAHIYLFGLIYHKPLTLPKTSFTDVKGPLGSIMTLADMYGCSSLAATHMENHLSNFQTNLEVLIECYKDISGMLEFSKKLRSVWLFREAMIHAVNDSRLPQEISDSPTVSCLIAIKRIGLLQKIAKVDQQLLLHVGYPKGEENLVHVLARAYFRDWFTHKLKKSGLSLLPGYAKVYRRIVARKVPSIQKFEIFLEKAGRPESVSLQTFCGAVLDCFSQAVRIVLPLVSRSSPVSTAILAKGRGIFNAPLTCVEVHEDELPWKQRAW